MPQPKEQIPRGEKNPAMMGLSGKWLATILVCIYYLIVWAPPIFPTLVSRWYVALGLAVFAFVFQRTRLIARAIGFYWTFFIFTVIGAFLSLLRATNTDVSLWNTIGMVASFTTFILFIPVLATRLTRRLLLFLLIGSSILWTFQIQRLANVYGTLIYSTFGETGENKNDIGYGLALAATALFYLAAFWQPAKKIPILLNIGIRVLFGSMGIYLAYYEALIYARGSLVATIIGFGFVQLIVFIKSRQKLNGLVRVGVIVAIIGLCVWVILPRTLDIAKDWQVMYNRATTNGIISIFNKRDVLFEKGVYLISQNPIFGVGVGGSRYAISSFDTDFPRYLIHNTFLTDWAEKGIFGLLCNFVWIAALFKIMRYRFFNLPVVDQIWVMLFVPYIVEMNFKNESPVVMVAILAGIYYEQYLIENTSTSSIPETSVGKKHATRISLPYTSTE